MEASAVAMSVCEELPPPDTVVGSLKFSSGKPASVSISFAGSVLRFSLSVTGTRGSLEASAAYCSGSHMYLPGELRLAPHAPRLGWHALLLLLLLLVICASP